MRHAIETAQYMVTNMLAHMVASLVLPALAALAAADMAGVESRRYLLLIGLLVAGLSLTLVVAEGMTINSRYKRSFPVVETERFIIRPRTHDDDDDEAYRTSLDDKMLEANGWSHETRDSLLAIEATVEDLGEIGKLIVVDKETDEAIGFGSLTNSPTPKEWGLGFGMMPSKRGQGLAVEALSGLLDSVHQVGVVSIRIGTHHNNKAMRSVIEKAGCTFDGEGPHELPNGEVVSSLWYTHRRAVVSQTSRPMSSDLSTD